MCPITTEIAKRNLNNPIIILSVNFEYQKNDLIDHQTRMIEQRYYLQSDATIHDNQKAVRDYLEMVLC